MVPREGYKNSPGVKVGSDLSLFNRDTSTPLTHHAFSPNVLLRYGKQINWSLPFMCRANSETTGSKRIAALLVHHCFSFVSSDARIESGHLFFRQVSES